MLTAMYRATVFNHPRIVLAAIVALLLLVTPFASNFRIDASSDSLVLENDQALKYFRDTVSKYSSADLLILTYAPNGDLFSDESLTELASLREKILGLSLVGSIISILDVPLTQSPPITLAQLNANPLYLLDAATDRELAKHELRTSALYRDFLVSDDFGTTAFAISLKEDSELTTLREHRNALRDKRVSETLSETEVALLAEITHKHQLKAQAAQAAQNDLIIALRKITADHSANAQLFLGGLPMIVTDSLQFIQSDVTIFGLVALLIIIFILTIAFREVGWVLMPLTVCFATGYLVICLLGLLNWPVSVVSSNFLSLLLIVTLSLNIHLIVRYRELRKAAPDATQLDLVWQTMSSKFVPCLYTCLTTVVAFASLIVSGIRPVIDFGHIMCLAFACSLVMTFILFPVLALMMKRGGRSKSSENVSKKLLNRAIAIHRNPSIVGIVVASMVAVMLYGVSRLSVENRFIDYFKSDTEIYQGMLEIDQKLGGTTPLDIILDAPASFFETAVTNEPSVDSGSVAEDDAFYADEDDFFEDDDDFDAESIVNTGATSGYWYNREGLDKIKAIHASLETLPATGKVLSLASSMSLFENLKDATPMDDIDLGLMYRVLSDDVKNTLFTPYLSEDANQTHINIRVYESVRGLDRNALLSDIRETLREDFELKDEQINLSGMVVLYNNMLNSLFQSQILTLGAVFLAILLMFIALFRRPKLAFITLLPNIFSAAFVLGMMGLFTIPLDLMTITIAAISVGIAVDNSIHFIHRFREEFRANKNYDLSLSMATRHVGQAMVYTTLVISSGFLIMVFSNFVPTVYFGLLTAIAMITALAANLLWLPVLVRRFQPMGPEVSTH